MPRKLIKQILAWSFSRWSTYDACPRKAKLNYLDKIQEPKNDAMARGSKIHKLAEKYTKGRLKELPNELTRFDLEFEALKNVPTGIMVEQQWAFNIKWSEVYWFANDTWCRMIVDAAYLYNDGKDLQIIDHKTGKIREEQVEQLELCIIGGFSKFPDVVYIKADFWYLDQGETRGVEFTRKDLPKLKAKWKKRTRAMLNDKIFAPSPGNACRWCFYKKANKAKGGGQCEY